MSRRLMRALTTLAVIVIVAFAMPLGIVVQSGYETEEVLRLQRIGTQASRDVAVPISVVADSPDVVAVVGVSIGVYAPDGRRIAGDGPRVADESVKAALGNVLAQSVDNSRIVVAVPVAVNEQVGAAVRVEASRTKVDRLVWRAWGMMAALAGIIIAGAAIAARGLARRLSKPVDAITSTVVRIGDGDFTARVPLSSITELNNAGQALNETARRLGELLERERAFSSHASHQMRTPLTAIRLAIETEQLAPRADRAEILTESLIQIERLEQTVDDLLSLARGTAGPRSPVDMSEILGACLTRWKPAFTRAGRQILCLRSAAGVVAVSEPALAQVLDVLVDNGLQHGAGSVELDSRLIAGAVVISIADHGQGIAPDDISTVIERAGVSSGRQPIGLSLARTLIEAEGGRLTFVQAHEQSRFEITLPLTAS